MVDADRFCVEVMHRLAALQAAIGKAAELIPGSHLETCVTGAFRKGDDQESKRTIGELLAVFGRYRRVREQWLRQQPGAEP